MESHEVDRPRPGTGYLALLLGLTCLTCVIFGVGALELRGAGRVEWIAAIATVSGFAALLAAPIDAAFRTRYEVSDREMFLKSGFVIKARIHYQDVAAVKPVGFIPRVLGWGGGRGLANRLTGGLRITL